MLGFCSREAVSYAGGNSVGTGSVRLSVGTRDRRVDGDAKGLHGLGGRHAMRSDDNDAWTVLPKMRADRDNKRALIGLDRESSATPYQLVKCTAIARPRQVH